MTALIKERVFMKKYSNDVNPELEGNSQKGKKVTLAVCILGILGEILMILNFLIFTKGISYHRHIPFALEITLLVVFATTICVCNVVTISGNRISRVIGGAFITATFFYNVMEFFLGLALIGAEDWYNNIPAFISCTTVMLLKFLCVKNIFKNKHIRAYFYMVNTGRTTTLN